MSEKMYRPQITEKLELLNKVTRSDRRDYIVTGDAAMVYQNINPSCEVIHIYVDSVKFDKLAKHPAFSDAHFDRGTEKPGRALRGEDFNVIVLEGMPANTLYIKKDHHETRVVGYEDVRLSNGNYMRVSTNEYLYHVFYKAQGLKDDVVLMRALRNELGLPNERKANPFVGGRWAQPRYN